MNDKIKVVIGAILLIVAVACYLYAQTMQSLETVGTMLLLYLVAMITGIAGIFVLWRYLPKIL